MIVYNSIKNFSNVASKEVQYFPINAKAKVMTARGQPISKSLIFNNLLAPRAA
jgi:hypothetical protein